MGSFQPISKLLPATKQRVKLSSAMEAAYIIEIANMILHNVYDERFWDVMRAQYFKWQTLTVAVASTTISYEARLKEKAWKSLIEKQTGVQIEKIVWKVTTVTGYS